jgi:hypothetical protein
VKKNHATRWLDGEISMGKLLQLEGVPYGPGSSLLGGLWQALHEKAYALDAELARKIKVANDFKALAETGDHTRTTKDDITLQANRVAALQEARLLLRFHILSCIDRTGAGAP